MGWIYYVFQNFDGATVDIWKWKVISSHTLLVCDYFSMVGLKIIHVSKMGSWCNHTAFLLAFTVYIFKSLLFLSILYGSSSSLYKQAHILINTRAHNPTSTLIICMARSAYKSFPDKIQVKFPYLKYSYALTSHWIICFLLPEASFGLRLLSLPACVCVSVCVSQCIH